ncbi:MAG: TRAP transporter large permease [Sneathiellaceae bacterium]
MIGELALLFGVLIGLLLLGLPIFFAIGVSGAAYAIVYAPKVPLMIVGQRFVNGLDSYDFAAIPFFFLAGEIMNRGGISARLLRFARAAIGHIRGGLSHVNVLASMVFAGVSGSAAADASAIGSVMIPAMKKEGYPAAYAASVTAASATIGPMIPPSIPLVIYALFAKQSVGQMFLAGVLPGLGMGLVLLAASIWISRRRGYPARPWQGWGEFARAGLTSALALTLPVIVVAGLVSGAATTTEIGAIASAYAVLVTMLVYRELSLPALWEAICTAAVDSCRVLIIIAVAGIFSYIIANMGLAWSLAKIATGMSDDPAIVLAVIMLILLLLGTVLEPVTLLVVIVPILVPTAQAVGIDPIQLGTVAVLATLVGLVTPPVGFLIYLTAAQAQVRAGPVIRELSPFVLVLILLLVALVFIPGLSLWLPRLFFG